jgi:hypothetical protein
MADSDEQAVTRRNRVEIVATVLLALAAVATAWSSYQANRWNGEQAKAASRTNAIRIDAARAQGLADNLKQVDVATFIQWVDAYATGEQQLQDFYERRFREEFKPAFDAWIATKPLTTAGAPLTPFVMPEYRLAAEADMERLDEAEAVSSAEMRRDIQRSANYVLAVVLFAVALFFAGISTKLDSPRLRSVLVAAGSVIFCGAVAWIATFPIRIGVS